MVTKLPEKRWDLPEIPFTQENQVYVYRDVKDTWWHTVKAFEAHPDDPYLAWRYLNNHPIFWQLTITDLNNIYLEAENGFTSIQVFMIRENPETNDFDPDTARNTRNKVEIETGHRAWARREEGFYTDPELSVRADTWEEAICELAYKVHSLYGNDRNQIPVSEGREPRWVEVSPPKGRHRRVEVVPVADVL